MNDVATGPPLEICPSNIKIIMTFKTFVQKIYVIPTNNIHNKAYSYIRIYIKIYREIV